MPPALGASIVAMLEEHAAAHPDSPCLSCDDSTLSWADMLDRSRRLAEGLRVLGVGQHDRVAYLDRNGPEFYQIMFGAAMVGAVTTGINWRLTPHEIALHLAHAEAKVVFAGSEFAAGLADALGQLDLRPSVILLDDRKAPAATVAGESWQSYERWLSSHPTEVRRHLASATDPLLQVYTSGTTGAPKGVVLAHAALMSTSTIGHVVGMSAESTVLVTLPVFHSAGSSWGLDAMMAGAHTVMGRDASAQTILGLIDRWRVTTTSLVPTVLQALANHPDVRAYDLSSLDTILYAGSPVSPALLQSCLETFKSRMIQIYGSTETQGVTCLDADDHLNTARPELLRSAGQALPGVTLRIVDPYTGHDVAPGQSGELWVKAPTAMSGYWRDPERTQTTITPDGYVRTGDLGLLAEGYLYLVDRLSDVIVTGGENVSSREVESVLSQVPGVLDVAVVAVPSQRWGETIHAVVVRDRDYEDLSAEKLIEFARQHLARFKCPTSVEFVSALPRNQSGKVLKAELRKPHWQDQGRVIG